MCSARPHVVHIPLKYDVHLVTQILQLGVSDCAMPNVFYFRNFTKVLGQIIKYF